MPDVERHPDTVDLAEYAEGLLDASRRETVEDHVRDCADCAAVLTDLAAVPEMLANAPIPPLPDDVATRLDQAIAAEAMARASEWSGTAAKATPIRPHRWLAPLAAAAAVIAVVAIAVPALNSANDDGGESSSDTSAHYLEGGSAEDGAAPQAPAAPTQPVRLSRASFGQDVIDAFYPDARASTLKRSPLAAESDSRSYYDAQLEGRCPVDSTQTTPHGGIVDIRLDGQPAYLLLTRPTRVTNAIAFTCEGDTAKLLASAALRLR